MVNFRVFYRQESFNLHKNYHKQRKNILKPHINDLNKRKDTRVRYVSRAYIGPAHGFYYPRVHYLRLKYVR